LEQLRLELDELEAEVQRTFQELIACTNRADALVKAQQLGLKLAQLMLEIQHLLDLIDELQQTRRGGGWRFIDTSRLERALGAYIKTFQEAYAIKGKRVSIEPIATLGLVGCEVGEQTLLDQMLSLKWLVQVLAASPTNFEAQWTLSTQVTLAVYSFVTAITQRNLEQLEMSGIKDVAVAIENADIQKLMKAIEGLDLRNKEREEEVSLHLEYLQNQLAQLNATTVTPTSNK